MDVRLIVTICLVPIAQSKVTELERIFIPMHEQMAAGLPAPEI